MQRLLSDTLARLFNQTAFRPSLRIKALLKAGTRMSRHLLPVVFIGLSLLTLALSWQDSAPLRGELFSALTVCSLLILLRWLSPNEGTNEN